VNRHAWRVILLAVVLGASATACGDDNPTKPPENKSPTILSLSVFPSTIGVGDSAVIMCGAQDADADTLVYDWITDDRVRLQGARPGDPFLYNSFSPSQVIYPQSTVVPPDTVWVRCYARDRKGKSDTRIVYIPIH